MEKVVNRISELEELLKETLTYNQFENLNEKLGVSKKMLTIWLKDIHKMPFKKVIELSIVCDVSMDKLKDYVSVSELMK